MDLATVKRRAKDGKAVKWRNKCWHILSIDEKQHLVPMSDQKVGYRGTVLKAFKVPISELSRAYQRRKAVDKQKA